MLFIALSACFYFPLLAQLQWPQPAKLMEYKPITWNKSSVNISDNVYHTWAQVDEQTSTIYIQAVSSSGDSLWQEMPGFNSRIPLHETSPAIVATSDNCLIVTWVEHVNYPQIRLKAQKFTQNGQRLWGEQGVYLTETFNCNQDSYNTFDTLLSDNLGGAYLFYNNLSYGFLIKFNNSGIVSWQNQIDLSFWHHTLLSKTYPDGVYLFTSIPDETQGGYCYYRYSDAGELINTGYTTYIGDRSHSYVFSDNSFIITEEFGDSPLRKYSAAGELIWSIPEATYGKIVFTSEDDFYYIKYNNYPYEDLCIKKYNSDGIPITEEVILQSANHWEIGIDANGRLIILYKDFQAPDIVKLQILNSDNTFEYEQGVTVGNPPLKMLPFTDLSAFFLSNSILLITGSNNPICFDSNLNQITFNYQGASLQQRLITESGTNYYAVSIYNQQWGTNYPSYFLANENDFTLFQLASDFRMYKLDSEGNNVLLPTGKKILGNIVNSAFSSKNIYETPLHNYICVYTDSSNSFKGANLNNTGDVNFYYDSMNQYFQFENKQDCIWAFYLDPEESYLPFAHRLFNENTFDVNALSITYDGGLYGVYENVVITMGQNIANPASYYYLNSITDDFIMNPAIPYNGIFVAHARGLQEYCNFQIQTTPQRMFLSWLNNENNTNQLKIQIIRKPDLSLVYLPSGQVIDHELSFTNYQIFGFDNDNINILYLDDTNGQNVLKLQKYVMINNDLISQFSEGGIIIADSVNTYSAQVFGNSLCIASNVGSSSINASVNLCRFSNDTNSLSSNFHLGTLAYQLPKFYPIDDQTSYLVWQKGSSHPLDDYNTFLVQKINITQLPVNDQTISPSLPLSLSQNYPNPFNPETTISFSLPVESKVKLEIYNIKGQKVTTLLDEQLGTGKHNITWKGTTSNQKQVSSGIYFYKLSTPDKCITRKMLLVK